MKRKTMLAVLSVSGAFALPALVHAGASQIWYQQKKAELAQAERPGPGAGATVIEVVRQEGMFTQFLAALETAGLTEMLRQPGTYTVFAPTDDAFAAIPPAQLQALLQDKPRLKQVLGYHIVPQEKYGWDLRRDVLQTLDGRKLTVSQYSSPEDIRINANIEVLEANIYASNGVVHAIDRVMIP